MDTSGRCSSKTGEGWSRWRSTSSESGTRPWTGIGKGGPMAVRHLALLSCQMCDLTPLAPAEGESRSGFRCASRPPEKLHPTRVLRRPAPPSARADGLPAPPRRPSGSPAGGGGSSVTGRSALRSMPYCPGRTLFEVHSDRRQQADHHAPETSWQSARHGAVGRMPGSITIM